MMGFISYWQAENILATTRSKKYKRLNGRNLKLERTGEDRMTIFSYSSPILEMYRDGSIRIFGYGRSITTSRHVNQYAPVKIGRRQVNKIKRHFVCGTDYYDGIRLRQIDGMWHHDPLPSDSIPLPCPRCGEKDMHWDRDICMICSDKEKEAGLRPM